MNKTFALTTTPCSPSSSNRAFDIASALRSFIDEETYTHIYGQIKLPQTTLYCPATPSELGSGDVASNFRFKHEKEYLVTLNKKLTKDFLKKMENGVPILNTTTRKCKTTYINEFQFKIVLTQGLNRQIRRMCEHFEYRVKKLERIRIINIKLDIPRGKWRYLTVDEVKFLKKL